MKTIRLFGDGAEFEKFVDNPPSGLDLGDEVVFSDDVFDKDGNLVGQHSGFCTLVRPPSTFFCQAVFGLPDGQISGGGLITFTGGQTSFTTAVTGGTKEYLHAWGQVHGTTKPGQTSWMLEVHP